MADRSPNKFGGSQKATQLQPQPSPNRRRHRSPIDHGDFESSLGEDPYSKSRSFDEDYANGYKKSCRSEGPVQQAVAAAPTPKRAYSTNRSLSYGRRLYEHNMVCGPADPNTLFPGSTGPSGISHRNRSPLMMHFRPEPHGSNKRIVEPEELDENEQFYHLKKLLSNANLQNNKNYQYAKSRGARNPPQSSETLVVADSAGRSRKTEGRRTSNLVSVTGNSSGGAPPPPVSSGRY